MYRKPRTLPWTLTCLVLGLAVSAGAQGAGGGEKAPHQPAAHLQVTQNPTIAVCGQRCECGAATEVTKVQGPCSVPSFTGGCALLSGECCVCAAAVFPTLAVCGNTCDCAPAVLLTKVSGRCTVTSSVGQCSASSGDCCLCAPN
jgi:hypothetical protein